MTGYVLIHGAWHGSWCWARVRRLLTTEGHEVFTPTLTGVGERSHLLSRDRLWPRAMAGRFRRFRRRAFEVNAADAAWVDHQCTLHPLSSLEDPDVGEASAEDSSDSGSARSARSAFEDGIAGSQERFRGLRRPRERAQRLRRRQMAGSSPLFPPQPTGRALVRHCVSGARAGPS